MQQAQLGEGSYSYAAQPHAAPSGNKKKTKYRDENELDDGSMGNLMNDPRVVRGSTYGAKLSDSKKGSQGARTNPPVGKKKFVGKRGGTPPPVDGRNHMNMQTDEFLEELTDRPIEIDQETQTQAVMDRPASPLFVRATIGIDTETQILPGDLFNFDLEVEPLLELLVGKTLHVSMLELMQEEELEAIRLQQEEFEAMRNVELAEVQRLEAESRRKTQEKERRVAQEKKRAADKKALEEKIAARSYTNSYLNSLHTDVFNELSSQGLFYDPVHKEIEDIFMADLITEIRRRADGYSAAQKLADELIENARQKAKKFEAEAIRRREELRQRLIEEALAKKAAEEEEKRQAEEAARKAAEEGEAPPAEE